MAKRKVNEEDEYGSKDKKAPTSLNLSEYVKEKLTRLAHHSGARSNSEVAEQIFQKYFEGRDYPPLPKKTEI